MIEKRFSLFLIFLTFGLLLLGGIVHNTGSSLACPDWPLCYGSLMPPMKGGVAIEHTHRLIAASVGLLTIVLNVILWRKRKGDRILRRLSLAALGLVVVQGVLGGITVIYRLPTAVSTAHLGVSMIFFSLLILIAWRLYNRGEIRLSPQAPHLVTRDNIVHSAQPDGVKPTRPIRPIRLMLAHCYFLTLLVYLQSLLGALVRHTGSGLVCPEIPLCEGSLWPAAFPPGFRLHMAHRWAAVFVAVLIFSLPFIYWKKIGSNRKAKILLLLGPLTVFLQVILGVLSVTTLLGVPAVTAHLGGSAILLGTMVSLCVVMRRPT